MSSFKDARIWKVDVFSGENGDGSRSYVKWATFFLEAYSAERAAEKARKLAPKRIDPCVRSVEQICVLDA